MKGPLIFFALSGVVGVIVGAYNLSRDTKKYDQYTIITSWGSLIGGIVFVLMSVFLFLSK
jgi:hypothetical protein